MFLNIFLYVSQEKVSKHNEKIIYTTIIAAIISLFIFLSLPYLRNYYFFNPGDSLSHLGYVIDIMVSGHFGNDGYPILHIWITALSYISGCTPRQIMLLIPQFFTILFIVFMFFLSRSLKLKKGEIFFVTALSILPIFGAESLYVVPSAEAFFILPLVLFLFIKSRTENSSIVPYSILLIIMLTLFPFFDQETSIFLFIILIIIFLTLKLTLKNLKFNNSNNTDNNIKFLKNSNTLIPASILFISFFIWFSSSVIFGSTVTDLINSILFNNEISPASILYTSSLTGVQLIYNIIKIYGVDLFYVSIASISTIFIIKRVFNKKYRLLDLLLLTLFYTMVIFNFLSYFRGTLIGLRTVKYLVLISIFIFSFTFYELAKSYKKSNSSKIKNSLLLIALMAVITLSVFNTYPSPIIKNFNFQITEESFNGMSFLINYGTDISILSTPTDPNRFKDAISGKSKNSGLIVELPVDHFGYENFNNISNINDTNNYGTTGITSMNSLNSLVGNLGNFYEQDQYLVVDDVTLTYDNNGKYKLQDFQKLETDNTVNKLYDNGGFTLYGVNGRFI